MMRVLRRVDARAWGAIIFVAVGFMFDWDSLAQEVSEDGVVESCSYYDVLDMIVGPVAILLAIAAWVSTDVGRHRFSTTGVSIAGIVGGVLVTMHGFGQLGGRCDAGAGEGRAVLVFLIILGVSLL